MHTETTTTSKPRRIDQIARAIVRDLRKQDRSTGDDRTPREHVTAWRDSARQGGDNLVVYAIDVLGIDEAARTYAATRPGSSAISADEERRLEAAWRRRFA